MQWTNSLNVHWHTFGVDRYLILCKCTSMNVFIICLDNFIAWIIEWIVLDSDSNLFVALPLSLIRKVLGLSNWLFKFVSPWPVLALCKLCALALVLALSLVSLLTSLPRWRLLYELVDIIAMQFKQLHKNQVTIAYVKAEVKVYFK